MSAALVLNDFLKQNEEVPLSSSVGYRLYFIISDSSYYITTYEIRFLLNLGSETNSFTTDLFVSAW